MQMSNFKHSCEFFKSQNQKSQINIFSQWILLCWCTCTTDSTAFSSFLKGLSRSLLSYVLVCSQWGSCTIVWELCRECCVCREKEAAVGAIPPMSAPRERPAPGEASSFATTSSCSLLMMGLGSATEIPLRYLPFFIFGKSDRKKPKNANMYFRGYGKPVKGFWGKGSGSKEWLISEIWSAGYWFQRDNSHLPHRDMYVMPFRQPGIENVITSNLCFSAVSSNIFC